MCVLLLHHTQILCMPDAFDTKHYYLPKFKSMSDFPEVAEARKYYIKIQRKYNCRIKQTRTTILNLYDY